MSPPNTTPKKQAVYDADTSDSPSIYLDHQEQIFSSPFDVLIITSLIFHSNRILLLRLPSHLPSWRNKFAVPMFRLSRTHDSGVGRMLNSRVDQVMKDAGDEDGEGVSVEEYARVAASTQTGLDPGRLGWSCVASALNTAVSPEGRGESVWLRTSLLWTVEEAHELRPDNYVCEEAFWASEEELLKIPKEDIIWGVRDDILTVFDLQRNMKVVDAARS